MAILKAQDNLVYQLAWKSDLQLTGVEEGRPQFMGNKDQMNNYFTALDNQ